MMIPVFLIIIMFLFLIINIMPSIDRASTNSRGYALLKKKFKVDKPLFLNFGISEDYLKKELKLFNSLDSSKNPVQKYKIIQKIINYGRESLFPLAKLLEKEKKREYQIIITQLILKIYHNEKLNIGVNEIREEDSSKIVSKKIKNILTTIYKMNGNPGFVGKLKKIFFDTSFFYYMKNVLTLDFGKSVVDNKKVFPKLLKKMKFSLEIAILSIIVSLIISLPLGAVSAYFHNTIFDKAVTIIQFFLYSLPIFFIGTILLQYFSKGGTGFLIFPTGGLFCNDFNSFTFMDKIIDIFAHLFLPVLTLSLPLISIFTRYIREGIIEVFQMEYIRAARSRGIPESVILFKHGLVNGIIPLLTIMGSILSMIAGGLVIIEYIFGIPGIGLLIIDSIKSKDYNMIIGIQILSSFIIMCMIFLSDILYGMIDPRIFSENKV